MTARIIQIARASLHDGPGLRTVVYLKGCSLRCEWCHNPEGQSSDSEIFFYPSKCIGCGRCVAACPSHFSISGGVLHYDRSGCIGCGGCARRCPSQALSLCGTEMSCDEVMEEIRRDALYYGYSGGGVTMSGGECLLYPAFCAELIGLCRGEGIHTALESALFIPWTSAEPVVRSADLLIADIKHPDSSAHRRLTGRPNDLIVENLSRAARIHDHILVRIPLIPGENDDERSLTAAASLLNGICGGIRAVELLKYNSMAAGKYTALGMPSPAVRSAQSDGEMEGKARFLRGWLREEIRVIFDG